jgi:hypothetical protein
MFNNSQKLVFVLVLVFSASAVQAISQEEVRHLLARTVFGANFGELNSLSLLP